MAGLQGCNADTQRMSCGDEKGLHNGLSKDWNYIETGVTMVTL